MPRRLSQIVAVLVVTAFSCYAQRRQWDTPKPVTLRFVVTIESDSEKAANVTVELMDAVGSSSAMDRKNTDEGGGVTFNTFSGLHRFRITGTEIQPYEGEVQLTAGEVSHIERVRVQRVQRVQLAENTSPKQTVAVIRLQVPESARKTFERGAEAMRQQKWQKSRELFESAIRQYPPYDMAYNGLGIVDTELKDIEGARQAFTTAIDLNPKFPEAQRNLARILLSERNNKQAMELLKSSLETDSGNAWALTNCAYLELQARDFDNAFAHALRVHALPHADFANAHMIAGYAAEALGRKEVAVKEFKQYLEEDPKGPNIKRARKILERLQAVRP